MLAASVIVPARDAAATLPRTLRALAAQRFEPPYEVIVVDDGSRDETAAVAGREPGAILVRQPALGPAAARNRGAAQARGRTLVFCDADVFPTPGWLRAGVAATQRADLVQGQVLPDPTARLGPFDRSIWVLFDAGLFEAANLFVTRDLFDRVGGFEQWLTPRRGKALAEDVWFGYRALRLGARTGFCAEALAHHAVFERTWSEYAAERLRLEYFPAMVRKMPEMRRRFLYRHIFLNRRHAGLDLALAAAALAAARGEVPPLLGTLPYLRDLRGHAMRGGSEGPAWPAVAAADLAADLVGTLALLSGAVRCRSLVL